MRGAGARLIAKQDGVLSGIKPFYTAFQLLEADVNDWGALEDGARFKKGDEIAEFTGKAREVLTAERVAMNFAQHLSGIATMTAAYMDALDGVKCRICLHAEDDADDAASWKRRRWCMAAVQTIVIRYLMVS